MPVFVLNDENQVNSYGFRILTEGIDLERFQKNPVMLLDHWNSGTNVIGRWKNIQVKDGKLTAEPEFDTEDQLAKQIAGKVERGFLNAVSMGIKFHPEDVKVIDGVPTLTRSELMEASIVAVPSNSASVRLYDDGQGKWLDETEVKELSLTFQPKHTPMTIKLSESTRKLLGVEQTELDQSLLEAKIAELAAAKSKAEKEVERLLKEREEARLQAIRSKVDEAIASGKINAELREEFIQLGVSNEQLFNKLLDKSVVTNLSGMVQKPTEKMPKTMEEFQAMSLQEQLAFKKAHPDKYIELVNK